MFPNPRGKNSKNSQIKLGTTYENKNSKVYTVKILLDCHASASIVHKIILHECHTIMKQKKKLATMIGTFNTTFCNGVKVKTPRIKSYR